MVTTSIVTVGVVSNGQSSGSGNGTLSTKETFTAGASQTVFNLSSSPNNIDVFLNEAQLVGTNKYTLVGSVLTLTNAPFLNTIVTVRKY